MKYLLIILMSGFTGWLAIYLSVILLFKPRKPVRFLFFTIQGIVPKRKAELMEKLGRMVSEEFLSLTDIEKKIGSPENIEMINSVLENKIDQYLDVSFPKKYPIMSIFVGIGTRKKIKREVMDEVGNMAPSVINDMISGISTHLDIESTVKDKLRIVLSEKLYPVLNDILRKEFTILCRIGAVLGIVTGSILALILLLFPNW